MTVEGIVNRLSDFFYWLFNRRWERWELLSIAIAASVILILIVRAHFKVVADAKRLRYRSPIIGIKTAHHGRRHF